MSEREPKDFKTHINIKIFVGRDCSKLLMKVVALKKKLFGFFCRGNISMLPARQDDLNPMAHIWRGQKKLCKKLFNGILSQK
jgi:hypothetical protein